MNIPFITDLNKGHCTWFHDKICGVNFGLACYDHDAAYKAGGFIRKLKADVVLLKDIWKYSSRADSLYKNIAIKGISILMYAGVSVPGILFWIQTNIKEYYASTDDQLGLHKVRE